MQWGWMLIYWNFAGVPFVYCIQGLYLYYEGPIDLPRYEPCTEKENAQVEVHIIQNGVGQEVLV